MTLKCINKPNVRGKCHSTSLILESLQTLSREQLEWPLLMFSIQTCFLTVDIYADSPIKYAKMRIKTPKCAVILVWHLLIDKGNHIFWLTCKSRVVLEVYRPSSRTAGGLLKLQLDVGYICDIVYTMKPCSLRRVM